MKWSPRQATGGIGLILPFIVLAITGWKATPSLLDAWQHDLYSRGGFPAFAIWTFAQVALAFISRRVGWRGRFFWVAASLSWFAAGGLSELNVFLHLALACAIPGFLGLRLMGGMALIASLVWLPASGYFTSSFKSGGLTGWERPTLALGFLIGAILLALAKPRIAWMNRGILKP